MTGSHTGRPCERIADGLFDLFHNVLGIMDHLGTGTGDNASNNIMAVKWLLTLTGTELKLDSHGRDFVGCLCHTANIAALQYISGEGKSRPLRTTFQ